MARHKKDNVDALFEDLFGFQGKEPVPEPETIPEIIEPVVELEAEPIPEPKQRKVKKKEHGSGDVLRVADLKPLPPNFHPATYMECGHLSWNRITEDDHVICDACANRRPPAWDKLQGVFIRPLPIRVHRTVETQETKTGFPGYCVDETGYYIGGVSNDCREGKPKEEWCQAHKEQSKIPITLNDVFGDGGGREDYGIR